jgi:hypothetical protein
MLILHNFPLPQETLHQNFNMINARLRREIDTTIEAIPEASRVAPQAGSIVSDPNSAFAHLQDWDFTHEYAFVISSSTDIRARFLCIHHTEKTRNFRKLT